MDPSFPRSLSRPWSVLGVFPPQDARERWFLGLVGGALALGLLAMVRLMEQGDLQDIGGEVALLVLAGVLLVAGLFVRGRQPRERRRSFLSPLAIGLALLALGIAALLDLVGAINLTVGVASRSSCWSSEPGSASARGTDARGG